MNLKETIFTISKNKNKKTRKFLEWREKLLKNVQNFKKLNQCCFAGNFINENTLYKMKRNVCIDFNLIFNPILYAVLVIHLCIDLEQCQRPSQKTKNLKKKVFRGKSLNVFFINRKNYNESTELYMTKIKPPNEF